MALLLLLLPGMAAEDLAPAQTFETPADGSAPGVLETVYGSSALAGANSTTVLPGIAGQWPGEQVMSAEFLALLTPPARMAGPTAFACPLANGRVRMWVDDHLLCDEVQPAPFPMPDQAPLPPFMVLSSGQEYFVRMQFFHNETTAANASVALKWTPVVAGAPPPPQSKFLPIAATALRPPPADHPQLARIGLQRRAATGWGTWWRPSALAATLLPEGSTVTAGLCQRSSGTCMDPAAVFTPEQGRGPEETSSEATSRPGAHAWDRSYWQLYVRSCPAAAFQYPGGLGARARRHWQWIPGLLVLRRQSR